MRSALVGAIASSRLVVSGGGLATLSYPSFPTKPGGLDVLQTAGAGAATVASNTLTEGNSSTSTGGYNSAFVFPEDMAITTTISVTVTVGALGVAANNRAVGPGVFSADGTKGVFVRFASASSTASLITWLAGAETSRTTSTQVANTGDTVTLTGTLSGGVWTWTVKKNGGADIAALTWADSSHLADLPGTRPAAAFRHQFSASQFPSRGISALTAAAT